MATVWMFIERLRRDCAGQDLIEYALMAGFVAVSAGALLPGISTSISSIFSQVASVVAVAAG
jgi:Flp pilus assembly pilin Flp